MRLPSITAVVIAVCLTAAVDGYSQGAPPTICMSVFPQHRVQPQSTASPYRIRLSQSTYQPSDTITLTVDSSESGRNFMGIILVAHRPKPSNDEESFVGTFNVSGAEDKLQVGSCFNNVANFVTHRNATPVASVQFKWIAPDTNVGSVEFMAAIVETKDVFWINIRATVNPVDPSTAVAPDMNTPAISTTSTAIDLSGCGQTKGCVLFPSDCTNNCNRALTFQKTGQNYVFEMMTSRDEQYLAMALSADTEMGDDEAILCTDDGSMMTFQHGYNPAKYNVKQFRRGLTNLFVKRENGVLSCKFTRPEQMTVFASSGLKTFDLSQSYYVHMALGRVYNGSDVIAYHMDRPVTSVDMVMFNNYTRYSTFEHRRSPPPTTTVSVRGSSEICRSSLHLVWVMAGFLLSFLTLSI